MIKKLIISLFIAFILIAGLYATLQGPIGRNLVRNLLARSLKESGLEIKIDRIEGVIPNKIDLKGISIQGKGIDATINELELRPILWRLVKSEIAFKNVTAKGISISQGPSFDFDGKFRINRKRAFLNGTILDWAFDARLNLKTLQAHFKIRKDDLLFAKGNALLNPCYRLISSNIQIESDQILSKLPFSASGKVLGRAFITSLECGYKAEVSWQIPNLSVEKHKVGQVQGKGTALLDGRNLKGEFLLEPYANALFDLTFVPNSQMTGSVSVDVENLQSLHLPDIYGKLKAKVNWTGKDMQVDATASEFYYGPYFAEEITFKSNLQTFDARLRNGKWHELELNTAEAQGNFDEWTLAMTGKWKHPLELEMDGNKEQITRATGTFFNHSVHLLKPVPLNWDHTQLEITVGDALILGRLGPHEAYIKLERLPLDFLSLNPLDVPISGRLTLTADLLEKSGQVEGNVTASLEHMEPFDAVGQFEGHLKNGLLALNGNVNIYGQPLFAVNSSIPVHVSLHPFEIKIEPLGSIQGQATLNTRIERFLDFIDLGPHRIEGEWSGYIGFKGTLYDPSIEGSIAFKDGSYENYYTGTKLQNIQAQFSFEKSRLILQSLSAQDEQGTGNLSAIGEIRLLSGELYPFKLDASFQDLQFVGIDLVTASASGQMHIEGNSTSALAKGDIEILKSDFSIPDHIPHPLPDLQVTYRNSIHPVPPPQTDYHPYPLFLDLNVTAPKTVFISGRGLNSEWAGDFHLGGTYTAIAAKGKLELINGQFHFSDRSFKLTEGALYFSGVEHEMPSISIAGTLETKGIVITARLHGPLNNPQISLLSNPPLPLSSIVSYLLFGQDLSQISGFQALQIATSLASLAGTGPDVMESTRRALGVDRIRIVSNTTEEGTETVALQVGKYVSEGVLVTFTQGTENSSTNISVEIELKNNFVFQIESDQEHEQGIFTLKWNLNY